MIEFIRFYKHCSTTLLFHFSFLVVLLSNSLNFLIRFTLAYSESVYPVGDKAYWDIPPHVASFVCRPPSTRFPRQEEKKRGYQVRGSMENIGPYPNHHPSLTNVADVDRKDTTKVVV